MKSLSGPKMLNALWLQGPKYSCRCDLGTTEEMYQLKCWLWAKIQERDIRLIRYRLPFLCLQYLFQYFPTLSVKDPQRISEMCLKFLMASRLNIQFIESSDKKIMGLNIILLIATSWSQIFHLLSEWDLYYSVHAQVPLDFI